MDLGFTMDATGSVDWKIETEFVKQLASARNISPSGCHASVIVFSNVADLEIKFSDPNNNNVDFANAVNVLKHHKGSTRMDKALKSAYYDMFSEANGMRKDVPKLLVFITDGYHRGPSVDYRRWGKKFRKRNIRVIVVGVGNFDYRHLRKLVAKKSDMHSVKSFDSLLSANIGKDIGLGDGMLL